jgi:type IV fimbrial biogenesis protein FimT
VLIRVRRAAGFTLPELMVGLTIVGILIALGAPSFATWLQSSKLSAAANGYLVGVQTARTEAIRRNVPVEFVLTDTPVDTANIANAAVASPTGRNWIVRAASGPGLFELVESRAGGEGGAQMAAGSTIRISGSGTPTAFAGTIAFNGFGGTADNSTFQLDVTNPAAGNCAASSPAGPMRCARIQVRGGGQVRMCDPAASAPGDTRGCA